MAYNKGKAFEEVFKQDWKNCFPKGLALRLYDQVGGMKSVNTPCDFICFADHKLFMVECKSHNGSSIPFTAIPQYERLLPYKDKEDVYPAIIVWFREKDKVLWVPITEAEKMVTDGEKSIKLRMLTNTKYNIIEVPSLKKKVYMTSDYRKVVEEINNATTSTT